MKILNELNVKTATQKLRFKWQCIFINKLLQQTSWLIPALFLLEVNLTVLIIDDLSSSPAKEFKNRGDIDKYRPQKGEVSFQRYDGTNVYQWHYRMSVYWHKAGPKFYIIENNKALKMDKKPCPYCEISANNFPHRACCEYCGRLLTT